MTRSAWAAAVIGTLKIQLLVIAGLSLGLWALVDGRHALACALSGGAIVVPHFITGLVLWTRAVLAGPPGLAVLVGSEGLKILLITAALFATRRWLDADIAWGGFLAGMAGALVAQWLALWFGRNS